jgi:SAM-dependent methyltransferase
VNACPVCRGTETLPFCVAADRLAVDPDARYQILRCSTCGLGWTHPQIPDDEIGRFYPSDYLGNPASVLQEFQSGRWRGTSSWRMEDEKARLVRRYIAGGAILDVGCGEGKFLWALDPERWTRLGLEVDRRVVAAVEGRVPGVRVAAGDLESARLAPGSLDVVTFWHVLEHLLDPSAAVARASEALRPGGLLIVSLPNLDSHQADWFRSAWFPFGDVPRHRFHFSRRSLHLLLRNTGLVVEATEFFSRAVNFHCWKHSLRAWLKGRPGGEWSYYPLKPILHLLPLLERWSGRYATMTVVARKRAVVEAHVGSGEAAGSAGGPPALSC